MIIKCFCFNLFSLGYLESRHRFVNNFIEIASVENKKTCLSKITGTGNKHNLRYHPNSYLSICTHCVLTYTKHCNGCPPSPLIANAFGLPSKVHSVIVCYCTHTNGSSLKTGGHDLLTLSQRFAWLINLFNSLAP